MNHKVSEYLRQAYRFAAANSDDPRTQTGAIIVGSDGEVISYGANRVPPGVSRLSIRLTPENKPDYVGHAERNSIANAARIGVTTKGLTMYAPWAACSVCAQAIIEGGIAKLVTHKQMMEKTPEKWRGSIAIADLMLKEAGVIVEPYDDSELEMGILFNGEKI